MTFLSELENTMQLFLDIESVPSQHPDALAQVRATIKPIPLHTSSRLAELSGVAGALDKDGYLLQTQP